MTGPGGAGFRNVAADHAVVGLQVGVLHGDANVYLTSPGAAPEHRFVAALGFLAGGMARRAETLIQDVVRDGYRNTEVAYYWTLATLSGRSFDHLSNEHLAQLSTAQGIARQHPFDGWCQALETTSRLLLLLASQEQQGEADPHALAGWQASFGALPPDRTEELSRHLEMILTGSVQDQLAAKSAEDARRGRMARHRHQRAWKFFRPDPAMPRPLPVRPVTVTTATWLRLACSGALITGGVTAATFAALVERPLSAFVMASLVSAGLGLRGWLEPRRAWLRFQLHAQEWRHGYDMPHQPPGWTVPEDYGHRLHALIYRVFTDNRPRDLVSEDEYARITVGVRAGLHHDLTVTYLPHHVPASGLEWLVAWHSAETSRRCRAMALFSYREQLKVNWLHQAGVLLGGLLLCLAGLWCLVGALAAGSAEMMLGALATAAGLKLGWSTASATYTEYRRHQLDRVESDVRLRGERAEFERWSAVLRDRPSDAEMARWLDHDKAFYKAQALKHYGLAHRDVISHVILTEAASDASGARVIGGPPRYTGYVVRVFLLTEGGVRQAAITLDFLSGDLHDERRITFRYDALASARVEEVAFLSDSGRRRVVVPRGQEAASHIDGRKVILNRAFQLGLVSGENITVVVENFHDGLMDRLREDPAVLFHLTLDSSGIDAAIRILEAAAAEGREWIMFERKRRDRRVLGIHSAPGSPRPPSAIGRARPAVRGGTDQR